MGAMIGSRARLLALPVFALIMVAVAFGAAARAGGAGPASADEQASIVASTVIVTLLGLSMLGFLAVAVWHLVIGQRRRAPGKAPPSPLPLLYQLLIGVLTIGTLVLLAFLAFHFGHKKPAGGAPTVLGDHGVKPFPKSSPLPYSIAAGAWTAAAFASLVAAAVLYPRVRRRLRTRGQKPFADLSGLQLPEPFLGADALREPLAGVVVADPGSEPDPRRAVMAAWIAMTEVIAGLWRPRQESEAPQEYVHEALVEAGVGSGSATRLTNLFEFARWGGRQVGEDMRAEAIAALEAVRTELQEAS